MGGKFSSRVMKTIAENNSAYCEFPKLGAGGRMRLVISDGHVAISMWPAAREAEQGWKFTDQMAFTIALACILNPNDARFMELSKKKIVQERIHIIENFGRDGHEATREGRK